MQKGFYSDFKTLKKTYKNRGASNSLAITTMEDKNDNCFVDAQKLRRDKIGQTTLKQESNLLTENAHSALIKRTAESKISALYGLSIRAVGQA